MHAAIAQRSYPLEITNIDPVFVYQKKRHREPCVSGNRISSDRLAKCKLNQRVRVCPDDSPDHDDDDGIDPWPTFSDVMSVVRECGAMFCGLAATGRRVGVGIVETARARSDVFHLLLFLLSSPVSLCRFFVSIHREAVIHGIVE